MKIGMKVRALLVAVAFVVLVAPAAQAQIAGIEVGTSLVSLVFNTGADATSFGLPSGGFGIVNPALYASLFVTPKIAVEPRIGLVLFSHEGDTSHLLHLAGEVAYFLKGSEVSSPYVFGGLGVVSATGADQTPVAFGFGGGYRMLAGGRVTIRFDGRFTHYTEDGGNSVSFGVSLGGIFGQK